MLPLQKKRCSMCNEVKSILEFHKRKGSTDGLRSNCKTCQNQRTALWKKEHPDQVLKHKQTYNEKHRESKRRQNRDSYHKNKNAILARKKQKRTGKLGYLRVMLSSAKARAKAANLSFDIDLDYLLSIATDYCPVDNLPFDWDRQLDQNKDLQLAVPSLDRIDSTQGYTQNNVRIIGCKWNTKKNNMNLDDLLLLVEYVRSATESKKVGHF
jgi:hypothetical protein